MNDWRTFILASLGLSLITACKPSITTDIYTTDLEKIIEKGEQVIFVPAEIGIPIQNADKCDQESAKMVPILAKYDPHLKFKECVDLKKEVYDMMMFITEIPITDRSGYENKTPGFFGVTIKKDEERKLNHVFLVKTENTDLAVKEIDSIYQFQKMKLEDIVINIGINNDSR